MAVEGCPANTEMGDHPGLLQLLQPRRQQRGRHQWQPLAQVVECMAVGNQLMQGALRQAIRGQVPIDAGNTKGNDWLRILR